MHIFIDANVYLSFYETSADALLELEKLEAMIMAGKATLWLPDQVKREFWKNREGSIDAALVTFQKSGDFGSVPLLVREDAEFSDLKKLFGAFEKKKTEIIGRVEQQVAREQTAADNRVRSLFKLAKEIDTSGKIFAEAHERALRHSPPGKQDGLGDRLSWIALLKTLPANSDLHIISVDGDFASEANRDEIKPYLKAEWIKKNKGTVKLWKRASQFLAAHFSDAAKAIQTERALLVERLETSSNFMTTHAVIAEFSDLSHLEKPLIDRLARAILDNSQVSWLVGDEDVKQFVEKFLTKYGDKLEPSAKLDLEKLLKQRAAA